LVVEDEPDSDYELFFRPIRGAIVPYVEVPLKPEFFTRIIQGPTSGKEFGERSLRMFLRKNGLDHVKVESPVISLRSLSMMAAYRPQYRDPKTGEQRQLAISLYNFAVACRHTQQLIRCCR
jgi:hypothetical protein